MIFNSLLIGPKTNLKVSNFFSQSNFDKYIAYLKSTSLSGPSLSRKLSSLSTFQKFLIKKNIVQPVQNPTIIKPFAPPLRGISLKKGNLTYFKAKLASLFKGGPAAAGVGLRDRGVSNPFYKYLLISSLIIIVAGLGVTLYRQSITKAKKNLAYTTASAPVYGNRFLSFQGRLTDTAGTPITSETAITFELYNTPTMGSGTTLYTSATGNSQTIIPDDNGIFSVTIGQSHGTTIPDTVFTQNSSVYLQITAGGEVMDPRQPIATVGYAINSESLQGLPPSASGLKNTVLVIDGDGNLNLGETSPTIKSTSGTLGIEGQSILLTASNGSGGDIEINPDASGIIKLTTEGNGSTAVGGFINATNSNISTGNLFNAGINNTNRGYNFISFNNYDIGTTNSSTRFSVDAYGNTNIGGTMNSTNISIGNTLLISSASEINLLDGLAATNGSIIYGNGSNLANSSVGSSGQILASNGAAAPSWIDPSTIGHIYTASNGIGLSGTDFQLGGTLTQNTRLNIGSTEVIYFQSSTGNIGIGVTAPTAKLHVVGDSYFTNNMGIGTTQSTTSGKLLSVGDYIYANNLGEIYASSIIATNDNSAFLNTANSSATAASLSLNATGSIRYNTSTSNTHSITGAASRIQNYSNGLLLGVSSSTTDAITGWDSNLFLNTNGNIGIGTTNPLYKLSVIGDGNFSTNLNVGGTLTLSVGASDGFVLTSDASGNAYWAASAGVGGTGVTGIETPGQVVAFAGDTCPTGWSDYTPAKGRTIVGLDAAQVEFDGIGETGGEKTHLLTAAEMPSHTHIQNAHSHYVSELFHDYVGGGSSYSFLPRSTSTTVANEFPVSAATATNQNTGGGGAHNNLQPYVTLKYCIKQSGGGTSPDSLWYDEGTYLYSSNYSNFVITDTGNVGIGTSSPTEKLQVDGNIVPGANLTYSIGTSSLRWNTAWINTVNIGASTWSLQSPDNSRFSLFNNSVGGTEAFTILNSGYVGIGTTNPTAKLSIIGNEKIYNSSYSASNEMLNISYAGESGVGPSLLTFKPHINSNSGLNDAFSIDSTDQTGSGSELYFSTDGTDQLIIGPGVVQVLKNLTVGGTFVSVGSTNLVTNLNANYINGYAYNNLPYEGALTFTNGLTRTSNDIHFGGALTENTRLNIGSTEVMYFQYATGNVGVGITNPTKKLEVEGNARIGSLYVNTDGSINTNGDDFKLIGGGTQTTRNYISLSNGGSGISLNANSSDSFGPQNISLNVRNTGAAILLSGGNVGIGTTNPQQKLDVNGKMAVNGQATIYNASALNGYTGSLFIGDGGNSLTHSSGSEGYYNVGNGIGSLYSNTTGFYNAASGYDSLYTNNIGKQNTAQGAYSLYSNTIGDQNTAQGAYSLYSNTDGSFNTALGFYAGRYLTDGSTGNTSPDYGLYLGYNTKSLYNNAQNEIVIGYNAIGNGHNSVVLGNSSITSTILNGNIGLGTTTPAAKLHVVGNSYFTDNMGIGTTPSATAGKLLSIGDNIYANNLGEIYASSIIDYQDSSAFLDPANSSATAASLSLNATGSIRFNTSIGGSHTVTGASSRIQNYSNGLLLGVSSTTTQGATITGWGENLFLETGGNIGIGTTNPGYKLHVVGNRAVFVNPSADNVIYLGEGLAANEYSAFTWNSTNNSLAIGTQAYETNQLVLTSSGNVGIGTTNPSPWATLEIGSTSPYPLRITTTNAVALTQYVSSGTGNVVGWGGSGNNAVAWTGGSEKMRIDNSGNVGIGTTNPGTKLEISNQAAFNTTTPGTGLYGLHFNGQTTSDYASGITWNGGSAGAQAGIYTQGSGAYGTRMYFATTDSYATGAKTRMTINHAGNIGMGTISPITKAHVYGTLMVDPQGITNSWSEGIRIGSATNGYSVVTFGANAAAATGNQANQWVIGKNGGDSSFWISGGTAGDNAFRILQSGNVGIGTASPNAKLHINGALSLYEGAATTAYPIYIKQTNTHQYLTIESTGSYESMTRYINTTAGTWYTGIRAGDDAGAFHIFSSVAGKDVFRISTAGTTTINGGGGTSLYVANGGDFVISPSTSGGDVSLYNDYGRLQVSKEVAVNNVDFGGQFRAVAGNYGFFIRNDGSTTYFMVTDAGNPWGGWSGLRPLYINNASGYVTFGNGHNDLAENYYVEGKALRGSLISIGSTNPWTGIMSDNSHKSLIGVISTTPGAVMDADGGFQIGTDTKNSYQNEKAPIALVGTAPTLVINENGQINYGDSISQSNISGFGSKSISASQIVGKALETFNPNDSICQSVNSIDEINWPENDGKNEQKPCYKLPDGKYVGKIMVAINVSWYDPDVNLTSTGQVNVAYNISDDVLASLGYSDSKNEIESATYSLTDSAGNTVERISQFKEIASTKIKTGLLSAKNIIADNIITKKLISQKTETDELKTNFISPLGNEPIIINGDASVSGTLTAQNIETTQVSTENLKANDATISGTLYADNIISRQGSFGDIMTDKISSLREELSKLVANNIASTSPFFQGGMSEGQGGFVADLGATSITLAGDLALSNNLVVGANLLVNGSTQLGNTFINGTFTTGEIAIKDNFIETTNTALYIQPSSTGSVHIMGNTLVIADNGDVTINGNLFVTGSFSTNTLVANEIQTNKLTAQELTSDQIKIATDSASTIIASDIDLNIATTSAKVNSNATAGTATLPAGKTELIISTDKVTADSMVYITPLASTNNQVLYVKNKIISSVETPDLASLPTNYFTISLDNPLATDLQINWWIIN